MFIMAHRGASGFAPENTMAAFKKALESDADCIELDVRLTKDGVPVVIHDSHIKRTSNGGKQFIHDLTLAELKTYDFGAWFSPEYTGERIPTLEEVLQLIQSCEMQLNIEIKNGPIIPDDLEEKVLDLVYKYNVNHRVMYSSFDHMRLQKIYALDRTAKIGLVFHINLINLFSYVDRIGIDVFSIHPNYFYITSDMVQQAHNRGIKVNTYTLDDPAWAKKYKDMGVDGLITNRLLNFN